MGRKIDIANPDSWPFIMTLPEVALILGLSRSKTYGMAKTGEIPVVTFGKNVRVRKPELIKWMEPKTA